MRLALALSALLVFGGTGFCADPYSCSSDAKRLSGAADDYEFAHNNYESARSSYEGACSSYGYMKDDEGACGPYGYMTNEVNDALSSLEMSAAEVQSYMQRVSRSCPGVPGGMENATMKFLKQLASENEALKAELAALKKKMQQ